MYYVYLLQSKKHSFSYVGCTRDLRKRFREHNAGIAQSTRAYAPFHLVYYEAYADVRDAAERERQLKHSGPAVGHLKKRIRFSIPTNGGAPDFEHTQALASTDDPRARM